MLMNSIRSLASILVVGVVISLPTLLSAQGPGTDSGQWTYLGGDSWHTRYQPSTQIDASNFDDLTEAWRFNAASFGASTPLSLIHI